jgi:hypothetical protein
MDAATHGARLLAPRLSQRSLRGALATIYDCQGRAAAILAAAGAG